MQNTPYSCLENPMDRGAWGATVHAVATSWTQLSTHSLTQARVPLPMVAWLSAQPQKVLPLWVLCQLSIYCPSASNLPFIVSLIKMRAKFLLLANNKLIFVQLQDEGVSPQVLMCFPYTLLYHAQLLPPAHFP